MKDRLEELSVKEMKKEEKGLRNNKTKKVKVNKTRTKFFVDLSKDQECLELVNKLLEKANSKTRGEEVYLKDLVKIAIPKLTDKDIQKAQENSLSPMQRLEQVWMKSTEKAKNNLTFEEFLLKKVGV